MRAALGLALFVLLSLSYERVLAQEASAPPVITYAPKRSFSQWVDDLPDDPTLLIGFIISLLSGVGFFFIMYSVFYELVMGLPFKRQSILAGRSHAESNGKMVH